MRSNQSRFLPLVFVAGFRTQRTIGPPSSKGCELAGSRLAKLDRTRPKKSLAWSAWFKKIYDKNAVLVIFCNITILFGIV